MDTETLLTLPAHLVERIKAILVYDIAQHLDEGLKARLGAAVSAVEDADAAKAHQLAVADVPADEGATDGSADGGDVTDTSAVIADEARAGDDGLEKVSDPDGPPTIKEESLERLSRWADERVSRAVLKRYRLDPSDYSIIALLAGTEVYIPPSRLSRLRAAEDPEKPNPFLPSYLSPKPPSIGKEFSALTKQLTTVLNVLFSIFGSAAAVYVAGTTGAGYSRETSVLLGVLAGTAVGIADAVLIWIFLARVKKGREERWERGVRMNRGSGALRDGGRREGTLGESEDQAVGSETRTLLAEKETGSDDDTGDASQAPVSTTPFVASGIRLRRRELAGPEGRGPSQ